MVKRFPLRLAAVCLLAMFACMIKAQTVSPTDAAEKALSFFNSDSRLSGKKMAAKTDITLHHTASRGDETYFYIFNKTDGGWVIVGGDEVCHDIIAFSETGSFNYDNAPSNLRHWLGGYEKEISHAIAETTVDGIRTVSTPVAATAVGGSKVEAMIKTKWDQEEPYWNMCPSDDGGTCLTGCVATAMAQVMNYWQWPKVGVGSNTYYDDEYDEDTKEHYGCQQTLTSNFYEHYYDWDNMLDAYSSGYTTAQANAVALLMYDCGVSIHMEYSSNGSGAWTDSVETALVDHFSYDPKTVKCVSIVNWERSTNYQLVYNYSNLEWAQLMYAEMLAGRPVVFGANDVDENAGHEFILDGYEYKNSKDYFHINFGWSGSGNGSFVLTAISAGGYQWNDYQDAVIGIQPYNYITQIYTATLADDGTTLQPETVGGTVTLPGRDEIPGYTFLGWSDNGGLAEATTTKPTILPSIYTPTKDVTLYPVYSYTQPGEDCGLVELLNEDFSETNKTGNNTTITGANTPWSGNSNFLKVSRAYKAGGAIRIGAKSETGYVQTKSLDATSGQNMTVQFDVKGWTTVEGNIVLSVTGCNDQVIMYSAKMADNFETKTAEFTLTSDNPQVTITTSKKRAFIDNVIITVGGNKDKTYYTTWGTYSDATMKITPAKWATFYAPYDVQLEEDIYAYTVATYGTDLQCVYMADGNSGTTNVIPAHTPVLLYKDASDTYTKTYQDSFSTVPSTVTDNCLIGAITAIPQLPAATEDNTNYVLQLGANSKAGWFSVIYDETNRVFNSLAANRAYLSIPTGASVKDIFDGLTAITSVCQRMTVDNQQHAFNLQGQIVNDTYRGIVIRNGRKFLSK